MGLEELFVEDEELCRLCGGRCCRGYPGMYLDPERFFSIYPEALCDFWGTLERRNLTVKVCMGVPIPAPKHTEEGCVFLSETGCTLPRKMRPCECLLLVPTEETLIEGEIMCRPAPGFSYVECFKKWKEFHRLLRQKNLSCLYSLMNSTASSSGMGLAK